MNRYERNSLIIGIIFGLIGAWVYEQNEFGQWLSNFFVIPPMLYYLSTSTQTGDAP